MSKSEKVIRYYLLCNKLKDIVRTGWKEWNVNRNRVESIAEHVYGVLMLAIAMYSEYEYDINIEKVLYMLSIHELEEIIIGDLTLFDITKEQKEMIGHKAISEILSDLSIKAELENLILEFDERKTKEAKFAFLCDKLECDLQSKIYSEENCVDLNNQKNNKALNNEIVKKYINNNMTFGEMWINFGQEMYPYDNNFLEISNFAKNNKLLK